MDPIRIAILVNYLFCILAVLDMIFIKKKKVERILAWTIFLIIPFVGLFIYLVLGSGLDQFNKHNIKRLQVSSKEYNFHIKNQTEFLTSKNETKYPEEVKEMILFNLNNADSLYSSHNSIDYFCDGQTALDRLLDDIKNAQSSIHMEFYIFANDKTGKLVKDALIQKAKQGVEVRLLYDAIGSIGTSKISFRTLKKAGGLVQEYLPPFLNMPILNFKANYRNHRKNCVIDGKIAYTGGFNIRDDHMGKRKKLSPWRDTTIRIVGSSISSFQNIFLSDWRFATKDKTELKKYFVPKYFPKSVPTTKVVPMQVIKSGPDSANEEIKACIVKMIVSAKKSVRIQTPYFVPDDTVLGAIKLALLSGVSVELMIPEKIDHFLVHFANYSYINDLLPLGLKVYVYKGFSHSKVVVVDDSVMTIGSCNFDIRSFALNFEANVVIYSEKEAKKYSKIFDRDIRACEVYDMASSKKKSLLFKMLTSLSRLFSAVL